MPNRRQLPEQVVRALQVLTQEKLSAHLISEGESGNLVGLIVIPIYLPKISLEAPQGDIVLDRNELGDIIRLRRVDAGGEG